MAPRSAWILKVADHRPAAEQQFELAFLQSLTTQERFDMVFKQSRLMLEMLIRHGCQKLVENKAGFARNPRAERLSFEHR